MRATITSGAAEPTRPAGRIVHVSGDYPDAWQAAKTPVIRHLARVSKPGLRKYVSTDEIPRVLGGLGIAILSTSRGIMTGARARKAKVGGELLAQIW